MLFFLTDALALFFVTFAIFFCIKADNGNKIMGEREKVLMKGKKKVQILEIFL